MTKEEWENKKKAVEELKVHARGTLKPFPKIGKAKLVDLAWSEYLEKGSYDKRNLSGKVINRVQRLIKKDKREKAAIAFIKHLEGFRG